MSTLKELRQYVDNMIQYQGEEAPCAWWIYNKEDILTFDEDGNVTPAADEVCERVLSNLVEYDYIYTVITDAIEQELL